MHKLFGVFLIAVVFGVVISAGCKKNKAPDAPFAPAGPTSGVVNSECTFTSSAQDPEDSVAIRFDWGDGDTSDWSRYVPSGETVAASHSWADSGSYSVRAQAKDARDASSDWSAGHQIAVMAAVVSWTRTFGGSGGEAGFSVQQTADGGYVITGVTSDAGGDVCLVKADASGKQQWYKTFGGIGWEAGYSVQQTADGGYVIAGGTNSYGVYGDVRLIKTDPNGDTIWTRIFGDSATEYCYSGQQTVDGGYVMAGARIRAGTTDVYLVKTDASGNSMWKKTFGGPAEDWGRSVRQTADGGYIVAGRTESYGAGQSDVYLVKTNSSGDTTWTRTFGGPNYDAGQSVLQTADGGYVIIGGTSSYGAGAGDVYLIKTDASGRQP